MYMQGKRITPEQGKVYQNKGGGEFLCIESFDGSAVMQNTASRWTFKAHGITQYEDGTVEWDYSTRGHFERWLKRCRLCETHFDFSTLIINKCGSEWALGLRGGTIRNISDEDRVYFCPECGRKLTDEDFRGNKWRKESMKSKWKVSSQYINGEKAYIALRILDISQPQHGGNVETKGEYSTDRDSVQALVDKLNREV